MFLFYLQIQNYAPKPVWLESSQGVKGSEKWGQGSRQGAQDDKDFGFYSK